MIVDKLKKQNTNLSKITLARFNNPEKSDLSIINDTISFVRQHKDILTQSKINNSNPYVVIVLDQFEVCLDHILDVYLNCQKSSKSLRDYLADGTNHSDIIVRDLCTLILFKKEFDRLRIIVVLRSDRYYDLRILGEYGQIPYNAFEVLGGCQVFS